MLWCRGKKHQRSSEILKTSPRFHCSDFQEHLGDTAGAAPDLGNEATAATQRGSWTFWLHSACLSGRPCAPGQQRFLPQPPGQCGPLSVAAGLGRWTFSLYEVTDTRRRVNTEEPSSDKANIPRRESRCPRRPCLCPGGEKVAEHWRQRRASYRDSPLSRLAHCPQRHPKKLRKSCPLGFCFQPQGRYKNTK